MNPQDDSAKLLRGLAYSGGLVAIMWLIHFVFLFFDGYQFLFANVPQKTEGLIGIITSPLIHADVNHLLSNSIPFLLFGVGVIYFYPKVALRIFVATWLISGLCVWIASQEGIPVVGSSGVVYGLAAFLFFAVLFRRERLSMMISVAIALVYGGMASGVFPGEPGISWQAHFFGALTGATLAWLYRKVDPRPRKRYHWEDEPEQDPNDEKAPWNYRQNWPGANNLYLPGEQNPPDGLHNN